LTIAFYVSGHGLGHASRDVELIAEMLRLDPHAGIVVRTSAPSWIFGRLTGSRVEVQRCDTDSGMVQLDSLRIDVEESARSAAAFYAGFGRRAESEAALLHSLGARLVVADVPPLACAAAHLAGLPSVLVANFTWDWIYAFYPEFDDIAPGVVVTTGAAYSTATLALRLPICGGFGTVKTGILDVPFIARRSARDPADTRRALGVDTGERLVLSSFGGFGVSLPYERLEAAGLTVLVPPVPPRGGLEHEDLVAAADVVVSKPGFGIVSECVANRTPLLYTSRGRFAEYDVMEAEMPGMLRCRHIGQSDLLEGNWSEGIERLLAQEEPSGRPRVDGAGVAAAAILGLLG
jgi:hypothetical protein